MADASVHQDEEHRELTESKSSGGFDGAYLLTALFSFVALSEAGLALFVVMDRTDGSATGPPQDVEADLVLTEFAIDGDLVVAAGNLTMKVENAGSQAHNLVVERDGGGGLGRTSDISSGGAEDLAIGPIDEGKYTLFCDIAGHRESGMEATFVVAPADAPLAAAEDGDGGLHGGDTPDWAALDEAMVTSMMQFPAETEGKGNSILEPVIAADGTYEFELTAAITPWEVEPGKFVDAWTYNGQVPGPQIRVPLGANMRIKLINDLPMGTDVHWHGVHTPNDMDGVAPYTQDLIEAGTEFTYEFVAEDPAIGMYHAHHHGQLQVTNGMFGAIVLGETPLPLGQTISGVQIPDEIELAEEIPMVLNDAGVIGLSLNGKSFPATEPSSLKEGDWMVIHYYNEGLQSHPMHLHQFPQLIFAKDGIPLDQPYYADTINVAPGERYSVLFQAEDPGVWVWHCHILSHVERETGMFGMVTAVIVEEDEAA